MPNEATCAMWGDPAGADQIGCERLNNVDHDELLLALGLTFWPLAAAAPSGMAAATGLARWAFPAAINGTKWWFTGTRVVSGGLGILPNLVMQFSAKGPAFAEYNLPSIAFDYITSATGYAYASWVIGRYGVRMLRPEALMLWKASTRADWRKLGVQQALFVAYACALGTIRAHVGDMDVWDSLKASATGSWMAGVKSQIVQTFLLSPTGRAMFPTGMHDPRVAAMDKIIGIVQGIALSAYFGLTPGGRPDPKVHRQMRESLGLDPVFGGGVGF